MASSASSSRSTSSPPSKPRLPRSSSSSSFTAADTAGTAHTAGSGSGGKTGREKLHDVSRPTKRRCVSSACIACRKRKSKCDGNTPACAACSSVYHTECVYDLNSDHRRKGVYKKDIDNLKTQNGTLQTLVEAILNYPEGKVFDLVREIRACDSLEDLAERISEEQRAALAESGHAPPGLHGLGGPVLTLGGSGSYAADGSVIEGDSPASQASTGLWQDEHHPHSLLHHPLRRHDRGSSLEAELSSKVGALRLEQEGHVRFIGATSNLVLLPPGHSTDDDDDYGRSYGGTADYGLVARNQAQFDMPVLSWTTVTDDKDLILHLITLYFTYHYPFFTTLSKDLFYREFFRGRQRSDPRRIVYCTPLLVNIMLALGCHFTSWRAARDNPDDSATAGDHFFREAKRIIFANDEHENPCLTTVQALALMSVREAGCGREATGWVYSGMSFRMAMDLGLHLDPTSLHEDAMADEEVDARRITFWGCFLFDKCWSNYMGRMPQLPSTMVTVPKPDVFPSEDSDNWVPYTDDGEVDSTQPSRIRAISLQISMLCEISNDILLTFYNPTPADRHPKAKTLSRSSVGAEFKRLGELFARLEGWRKKLPPELEARGGSLPSALLMHMFHQTLYIHLFRPFLKFSSTYNNSNANANSSNNTGGNNGNSKSSSNSNNSPSTSTPLSSATTTPATAATPSTSLSHLDPRKACLAAATTISKYLRFYKHRYKLHQICNVAGYFIHSAATIHLLNLPQKTAARDIVQALQALEEMGECWLVARRSLVIIDILVRRWRLNVPADAGAILLRSRSEAHRWGLHEKPSSASASPSPTGSSCVVDSPLPPPPLPPSHPPSHPSHQTQPCMPMVSGTTPGNVQPPPPPPPPQSQPPSLPQHRQQHPHQQQAPYASYAQPLYAAPDSPQQHGGVVAKATAEGGGGEGGGRGGGGVWRGGGVSATHDQWQLRDHEGLGVDLAGLGELGWEEGDVTGVNWAAESWDWGNST